MKSQLHFYKNIQIVRFIIVNKIDKIMIVAHPDDEALFGGAELLTHPDEYKVVVIDE